MIKLWGKVYDLTDIDSREELHKELDKWVEDNFEELLMNGELAGEVSQVHELISEQDSLKLNGTWFNGNLQIEHWYEPLTDYLNEMEIRYEVLENGDVDMFLEGQHIIFSRKEVENKRKQYLYEECVDGIIKREVLEKYGLYYVKDYYLPKIA